jgi:hypothetical protein
VVYGINENAGHERIKRHISWAKVLLCGIARFGGGEASDLEREDPTGTAAAAAPDC